MILKSKARHDLTLPFPRTCGGDPNIQPMSKDVQAEMLDRLKDTEVRV